MEKKSKIGIFMFILLVAVLAVFCFYNPSESDKLPKYPRVFGIDVNYCEGIGYEYDLRLEDNRQIGYCVFHDGNECEAFAFVTGECGREYSLFESQGHLLNQKTVVDGDTNATFAICIFPDYTYCKEVDFYNKKCHVGW